MAGINNHDMVVAVSGISVQRTYRGQVNELRDKPRVGGTTSSPRTGSRKTARSMDDVVSFFGHRISHSQFATCSRPQILMEIRSLGWITRVWSLHVDSAHGLHGLYQDEW
jgi:hypothetical protein